MARAIVDSTTSGSLSRRLPDPAAVLARALRPPGDRLIVLDPRASLEHAVGVATRHRDNFLLSELAGPPSTTPLSGSQPQTRAGLGPSSWRPKASNSQQSNSYRERGRRLLLKKLIIAGTAHASAASGPTHWRPRTSLTTGRSGTCPPMWRRSMARRRCPAPTLPTRHPDQMVLASVAAQPGASACVWPLTPTSSSTSGLSLWLCANPAARSAATVSRLRHATMCSRR